MAKSVGQYGESTIFTRREFGVAKKQIYKHIKTITCCNRQHNIIIICLANSIWCPNLNFSRCCLSVVHQ